VRMSCIITCELKVMVFSPKWFAKIHFIDTRLSTHLKHTQIKRSLQCAGFSCKQI
jgi:hypothetical protein